MSLSESATAKPVTEQKAFHVLIVDDDPEVVDSIRYAVSQEGYEVSTARDGNQALAYVEVKAPDLIILDLMMPRRSGFLVLERLCQMTDSPIPVIVITANEGNRHREYAKMLGAREYITKPFVMERLVESVAHHLK